MSTRAHSFWQCRSMTVGVGDVLSAFTSHMTVTPIAIGLKLLQLYIVYTLLKQLLLRYFLIAHDPIPEQATVIVMWAKFLLTPQPDLLISCLRRTTIDIKIKRLLFIYAPLRSRFSITKDIELLTLYHWMPNSSSTSPVIIIIFFSEKWREFDLTVIRVLFLVVGRFISIEIWQWRGIALGEIFISL